MLRILHNFSKLEHPYPTERRCYTTFCPMAALVRAAPFLPSIPRASAHKHTPLAGVRPAVSVHRPPFAIHRRHFATPQKPTNSFFGRFMDNIREEDPQKKQMRESMERLTEDINKFSQSDNVQKVREQYTKIESETAEGAQKARQQMNKFKEDVKERARDSEVLKKAGENMQKMGENISSKGEQFVKTEAYQKISAGSKVVKEEFDNTLLKGSGMKVYKAPKKLRMRSERNLEAEQRIVEANPHAQGMVLHKNSKILESWNNFKDNNKYVNNLMGLKTKLDESDNIFIRATYSISDRVTDLLGGMFNNSVSQVLTDVTKVDPKFDIDQFLLEMEYDIIPNVLEALIRPELPILKDWTFERIYAFVSEQQKSLEALGYTQKMEVLDLDGLELVEGIMGDEGPMLIFRFKVQMTHVVKDSEGKLKEDTSPDKVIVRHHLWGMIRDQNDFNPKSAWKVIEINITE